MLGHLRHSQLSISQLNLMNPYLPRPFLCMTCRLEITYIADRHIPLAHIPCMTGLLEHGLHQVQRPHSSVLWSVSLEVAVHWISVAVRPQHFNRVCLWG